MGHSETAPQDTCFIGDIPLDADACHFYRQAMRLLEDAGVPYLVGGAYALQKYTGIARHTKDFDFFMRRHDVDRALEVLGKAGLKTGIPAPHWLAKAHSGELYVDIIFGSGNGVCHVDDEWFEHAPEDEVLGVRARLCPAEEIIWQKAFIQERNRYDGADIAHLIRARGEQLDWGRLLRRFGEHWRVLLAHLILFGFIYPSERDRVPDTVMHTLIGRLRDELRQPSRRRICRGTLLSRHEYLTDIEQWGYKDARLK